MFRKFQFPSLNDETPNGLWAAESIPSDLGGLEGINLSGILTNRLLAEE